MVTDLFTFLKQEYMDNGYMYSGSWPYDSLKEQGYNKEQISRLLIAGLIQKRDCEDYAFELTPSERIKLIAKHNLCSVWYEKKGSALLPEIQQEARSAAAILASESGLVVSTLRATGNSEVPDKTTVQTPFSIGQIIPLEYDLPRHMRYGGYSQNCLTPGGVAVGEFIVTDIFCNLLVNPPMNMIEVQSLDKDFNQIHPDARTMLLFEDVVLKRMKNKTPSLDAQIDSATSRAKEFPQAFDPEHSR